MILIYKASSDKIFSSSTRTIPPLDEQEAKKSEDGAYLKHLRIVYKVESIRNNIFFYFYIENITIHKK
jgi:hypothetical protein